MLYKFLKLVVGLGVKTFFKNVRLHGKHLIPGSGPLIVAANHPNTLMDPLVIALQLKQEAYFLAKGSAFNSPLKKRLLPKLNMVPVYRQQDGGGNNAETFQACTDFLAAQGTLLIFPEGVSFSERKIHKIKTGTARIALEAEAEHGFKLGVKILPVGLNYSDPHHFRGDLLIAAAEPIIVSKYAEAYLADPIAAVNNLTEDIKNALEELTVVIQEKDDEDSVAYIEKLFETGFDFKTPEEGKEWVGFSQFASRAIGHYKKEEPILYRKTMDDIKAYFDRIKQMGLLDETVREGETDKPNKSMAKEVARETVYGWAGLPLFLYGLLNSYIPYRIPGAVAEWFSKEIEYRAPVMMVAGILSFSLFYPLQIAAVYMLSDSLLGTLLYAASLAPTAFFPLWYAKWAKKLLSKIKLRKILWEQPNAADALTRERKRIVDELQRAARSYRELQG